MKLNTIDIFNEEIIFTRMKPATQLRAELDAYYARLYGLTRDELGHILNLKKLYKQDLHLARRRFPEGR